MTRFAEYAEKYDFAAMRREDGILELCLHTDGGPLQWAWPVHRAMPWLWADVAGDPATRIVILTGTGDTWIEGPFDPSIPDRDAPSRGPYPFDEGVPATGWNRHDYMVRESYHIIQGLLDIDVPVIAAINGPAHIHAEIALLCDIVLAADTAVLSDKWHFYRGWVPGDGAHFIWPFLLGMNRGRYFTLTGQEFSATQAQELGLVAEVLPRDDLLSRAWELARELNEKPRLTLRYTRFLLVRQLKKLVLDELGLGLHLEGISVASKKADERLSD
jgi:enoyl-CoA hydratase/carnithine racemase